MTKRRQLVATALIPNARGHIFVQRRSLTRRMFPGCWDLVGGHVEVREDLPTALKREIKEETGWDLVTIGHELLPKAWHDGPTAYDERQFIVEVNGDLDRPTLEKDKVSECMWVGSRNIERLKENRQPGDHLIYDSVLEALEFLRKSSSMSSN